MDLGEQIKEAKQLAEKFQFKLLAAEAKLKGAETKSRNPVGSTGGTSNR